MPVNPYTFDNITPSTYTYAVGDSTTEARLNLPITNSRYLKWELDQGHPAILQIGEGSPAAPIAAGASVGLATICGITSYCSNYDGAGVGNDREGFYMTVFLNGQRLRAGAGKDYREANPGGAGKTTITMNSMPLETTDVLCVEVRRL